MLYDCILWIKGLGNRLVADGHMVYTYRKNKVYDCGLLSNFDHSIVGTTKMKINFIREWVLEVTFIRQEH